MGSIKQPIFFDVVLTSAQILAIALLDEVTPSDLDRIAGEGHWRLEPFPGKTAANYHSAPTLADGVLWHSNIYKDGIGE